MSELVIQTHLDRNHAVGLNASVHMYADNRCNHNTDISVILPTELRRSHAPAEYAGMHNNNSRIMPAWSAFLQVCTYTCLTSYKCVVTSKHTGVCTQSRRSWGRNADRVQSAFSYRDPAPFHRLTPNKRFEPVFSTVIMAVCSLFNRMLLLTDLIPVHLLYCGQTVMIGCNHTSFEWTRAVRHIYGIIHHMQGLY